MYDTRGTCQVAYKLSGQGPAKSTSSQLQNYFIVKPLFHEHSDPPLLFLLQGKREIKVLCCIVQGV